jgi:hypothetical protein
MKNLWGREPAAVLAIIQTGIAFVVAFGLDLSGEQVAGIMALSAAILGAVTRATVTPATGALERLRGLEAPLNETADEWETAVEEVGRR